MLGLKCKSQHIFQELSFMFCEEVILCVFIKTQNVSPNDSFAFLTEVTICSR